MYFFRGTWVAVSLCFFSQILNAQRDSSHLRISLMTCGPGDELYSTFGHTGIRIIDSSRQIDAVFNYGMFDDSDPYFYLKFTRGIMRYSVAAMNFPDFMQEYVEEKRTVTEQVLQLDYKEKINLYNSLKDNLSPENRDYDYQFCKDNCTTRAGDKILRNVDRPVIIANIVKVGQTTYRQMIHQYLDSGNHSWDKFGIDLVLGSHLDEKVDNKQALFLPDYLMKGFDSAHTASGNLVKSKTMLLPSGRIKENESFLKNPLAVFSLLAVVFILLSFSGVKILTFMDTLFFFLTGIFGILIATLWIIRVDDVCRNNLNIIWALPTNLIMAFLLRKKSAFIKYYFLVSAILSFLLLALWFWLPQQLNPAFAPILLIIAWRGTVIGRKT